MFDADGVLKLADFGLAINMNEEHAVTRAGEMVWYQQWIAYRLNEKHYCVEQRKLAMPQCVCAVGQAAGLPRKMDVVAGLRYMSLGLWPSIGLRELLGLDVILQAHFTIWHLK